MMNLSKTLLVLLFVLLTNFVAAQQAVAHMMAAQHGTLNIVDDGAFMVLSLPISAFKGIDDDNDGAMSIAELNHHRATITNTIQSQIALTAGHQTLKIKGILLSHVTSHHGAHQPVSQLIVMGRFTLIEPNLPLDFHVNLFGATEAESSLTITATRQTDKQKHTFILTPSTPSTVFFNKKAF